MKILDKVKASLGHKDPTYQQAIKDELEKAMNQLHHQMNSDFFNTNNNSIIPPGLTGGTLGASQGSQTFPPSGLGQALGFPQGLTVPWSQPPQLTDVEMKELAGLEQERAQREKNKKLEVFKALPREFRQSIINVFLWEDAVDEMNTVHEDMSAREAELVMGRPLYVGSSSFSPPFGGFGSLGGLGYPSPLDSQARLRTGLSLPNGITKEELLQAHVDASMEEELRGE